MFSGSGFLIDHALPVIYYQKKLQVNQRNQFTNLDSYKIVWEIKAINYHGSSKTNQRKDTGV